MLNTFGWDIIFYWNLVYQCTKQIFYYNLIRIPQNLYSPMNRKFTFDQYDICFNFKTDNVMTVSAEYLPTGEYFLGENLELMRIKKDTVFAIFEKKSEKNLKCEMEQLVDKNSKILAIKFIVSFDFLPEFSQQVTLQLVEKPENIKNMQVNNFRADIENMEKMLNAFEKNGVIRHSQLSLSVANNQKLNTLKKIEMTKGKYLLRLSGIYTNSLGQLNSHDKLTVSIEIPGQKESLKKLLTLYSNSGYSYPFSMAEIVDTEDGEVVVNVQGTAANWNLTNTHLTTCPIAEIA